MSKPRPFFIVGSPRSGTGLFRDLLRSHPHLTLPGESHFIPLFYRAYGNPRSDREAQWLAAKLLRLGFVEHWQLGLTPADFTDCRSYREILERLFGAWAHKDGKPRWGEKTPQYAFHIPTLREIFPEAQFIHIYRDGRDVALSMLQAHVGPENTYAAARLWKRSVLAAQRFGRDLPKDCFHEVQYESLLTDPMGVMRSVCEFLQEPFHEEVLKPNFLDRLNRRAVFGQRAKTWVAENEIVSNNFAKWKTKMSVNDRNLFQAVAGDVLAELGYEIQGQQPPLSAMRRAYWTAHNLVWRIFERLNTQNPWWGTSWFMFQAKIRCRFRGIQPG